MRRINRSAILDFIRRNSPISRSAIARKLGLSRQGLYKKIARYGMTDLIHTVES